MNKEELLQELNGFVESPYNVILLDGPWGSGKTYLLNEYLHQKKENTVQYFYVSLHGLKSVDEINTALYRTVYPKKELINSMIPGVDLPFPEENNIEDTLKVLLKLEPHQTRYVVCFDDLERYGSSDYDALLSYLNRLVSHRCKIIVISNLLDFGDSELYLFDQYKEKIFDRIYKARLFDSSILERKYGKYALYLDDTIRDLSKNNFRLVEKIQNFSDEVFSKIEIQEENKKTLFYYIVLFLSTYYEPRKLYLNKVCNRLSLEEEKALKEKIKDESIFLDINKIIMEHINYKMPHPTLDHEYLLIGALYIAYMYCEYTMLQDYVREYL